MMAMQLTLNVIGFSVVREKAYKKLLEIPHSDVNDFRP